MKPHHHEHLEILVIACGNEDGFHEGAYFLGSIVVVGESMVLTPSREEAEEVFSQYPDNPILMLVTPCKACLAKGITSTPYFTTLERGCEDAEE